MYTDQRKATAWAQLNVFQNWIISLVVELVASAAFLGDYKKDPFNFQGYNIRMLTVTKGAQVVVHNVYESDDRTKVVFNKTSLLLVQCLNYAFTHVTTTLFLHWKLNKLHKKVQIKATSNCH